MRRSMAMLRYDGLVHSADFRQVAGLMCAEARNLVILTMRHHFRSSPQKQKN
jgi:hypothetical protein